MKLASALAESRQYSKAVEQWRMVWISNPITRSERNY